MLDPLSALSVAGNVVQIVEVGSKLIKAGAQLHRHGQLIRHAELQEKANELAELTKLMKQNLASAKRASKPETEQLHRGIDQDDDAKLMAFLAAAVESSATCASDMSEALQEPALTTKNRVWNSFRAAFHSVLGESRIEGLAKRLSSAERQMQLFLILFIGCGLLPSFTTKAVTDIGI